MSEAAAPPAPVQGAVRPGLLEIWRSKDPGYLIAKRSVRAAVVMPSVFAVTHALFSDPQVGLFGAFGSFALLLLVEFSGPVRARLVSFAGLFVVGVLLVSLGTAVSTHEVAAVVTMGVVAFVVLFAGILAPQAAGASTAALLTFVLPVSIARPVSATGPRLLGWSIAAVACTAACLLVWPAPWHDDLRRRLSATLSALARLVEGRLRPPPPGAAAGAGEEGARSEVARALTELRRQFSGTPYPPTGAAAGAVALSKLVGRVEWVAGNAGVPPAAVTAQAQWADGPPAARAVLEKVAETLELTAALVCDGSGHPVRERATIEAVERSARELDELVAAALRADVTSVADASVDDASVDDASVDDASVDDAPESTAEGAARLAGTLDPGFRARALGIATGMVADGALEAAGAPGVLDRRLGAGSESDALLLVRRLRSHLSFRSVWFRNSLRGAIGLAIAVVVIEVTDVQHGFWVALGTMSVLRSNALGTGATALRAVGGTALGVVVGAALMMGISDHTPLLWALLPLAVLLSGVAPSMISFVAGQAAFTVMVVILFNIIQPVGWRVGLTRIEDVAIGCGVSVVVGFLFWPRGATAALGRALSQAFVASSAYLSDAVDRLTMTSRHVETEASQQTSYRTYLLLDDAYRQFFAERGAKVVPLETVSGLFTGSNRIRLAAFTLATMPVRPPEPGEPEVESIAVAEAVLRDSYASTHRWYEEFADLLADRRSSLDPPLPHGEVLHHVLGGAFEEVRARQRGDRVQAALQMLWADELLESQATMQRDLLEAAALFSRARRRGRLI